MYRNSFHWRACCSFLLMLLPVAAQAAGSSKYNVLMIAADDLKPVLGCYGDPLVKSPAIDRLSAMGTTFLNGHCQQAVCGPTRASLLTGKRPDYTRVWDLNTRMRDINPDILTIPQHFKANGYESVGIGKIFDPRCVDGDSTMDEPSWSRAYVKTPYNPAEEFGLINADTVAAIRVKKKEAQSQGITGWNKVRDFIGGTPPAEGSEDVADEAYEDGEIAAASVALIRELAAGDKPFFLAVGFKKPHLPFVAPKKYWDLYDRAALPLATFQKMPDGAPAFHFQDSWELKNGSYSGIMKDGLQPDDVQRELIHGYYACVSYMDAQVGKLMRALEEAGVADRTVIVLWGDHGWHLGDHGMWCKHTNYEQATRIPLIIYSPRMPGGSRPNAPVEFVDVFPTLCDLVGIPTPENLDGVPLTPMMKDSTASVKAVAISQFPRNVPGGGEAMGYAFRNMRYRYIEWVKKDYRAGAKNGEIIARELYDYETDPLEQRNLAEDPAYADALADLMAKATAADRHGRELTPSP